MCETKHFDIEAFCEALNHSFGCPQIPVGFIQATVHADGSFNLRIGPRDVTFDCTGHETGAGTSRRNEWLIIPCMPHQDERPLPPEPGELRDPDGF